MSSYDPMFPAGMTSGLGLVRVVVPMLACWARAEPGGGCLMSAVGSGDPFVRLPIQNLEQL